MAGIFANIDSDISKLRKLKAEIDGVKKALQSIDVKVNIDIAQGLEARLKSLTGQYDALVQKAAQADAKIAESAARINQSAEKVIKAQEQMARAAGAQPQAVAGGTSSTANQAQTASVQAQAKAYDELAQEIDEVIGTRAQNIRRIVEEQNAIKMLNAQMAAVRKNHTDGSGVVDEKGIRLLEHYNNRLEQHKIQLAQARQQLANNIKLDVSAATSMNALSQSLGRMRMAYRELTEEERKSQFGQELLASIQQADAKIKQLDATIGNHQRNVGNYASGWNGLNMSIQQIGRELPSLAMGINTFFLAISNNLPILTDEIARARKEYNALKAAGQAATPVWKQVVSSLVSWQTALTVGITLLTLYGKDIIEWVGNLFKGEKQVDTLAERMKTLNDIQREAGLSAAKERSELDVLYKATQDHTRSLEERNAAADELQRRYPKYFENLSNEAILAGNASSAYKQLTDNILKAAQARAAQDKITKNYERMFQLQRAINADTNWTNRNREKTKAGTATRPVDVVTGIGSLAVQQLTDDAIEYNRRIEALKKNNAELARLTKDNEYYAKLIDVESLTTGVDGKGSVGQLKDYLDEILQLRADNEDRQVDLMADGTEKELAEIDLRYKRIRDKVRELEANLTKEQGGKLTADQSQLFAEAYNQIDRQQARDRADTAVDDGTGKRLEAEREAMNRYLKDYGTFQERRKAITDEYAQKIADAGGAGTWQGKLLQKQMEEALAALDLERLKKSMNWELIFGDLSKVSKTELDKVKNQLEDFRDSSEYKKMTVDQKKVVDESLANIKTAMIKNGGLLGDLPNQLSELREAQDELTKAQDEYNEALKNGTEAEKEAALDKRNSAQNKVAVAQRNVSMASDKTIQSITTLGQVISELGSASEMSMADMGNMVQQVASLFGEMGSKVGGIIGAALSLIGTIQEQGLGNFLKNMGKMGNDLARETSEFFTFGLIDFGGESDENLESDIERLTASNGELEKAITNLADKMDDAAVADASGIYEQQRENLEQMMKNTQEMMQRSAAAYSNGFLGMGGTHSSANKIDEGMSAADWQAISDIVGRTIDSAGDFFNLTSEEMWRVANEATTEYAKLKDLADNGHKDAAQFMDEYIEYWKELEELQDAYNEKLTSVSFDSIKDDFRNALLDMEDSTEAFAENFEEMMKQAMLESMMTGAYDQALKEWYQDFSDAMKDGTIEGDQESLRKQWQEIVDGAAEEWNALKETMGWESDSSAQQQQSASRGGYETMTQDQATELSGRFTALYESNLRLEQTGERAAGIADEVRSIIAQSYIELQLINENTGAIVKPIQQMQRDIEEVKRNTSRI